MQYFAQDEATRLDPTLTVYQTLAGDAPIHMVPHIRNILGGFLFSGDDIDKPVRVLSGGERTRLAVARMLLRPSNTLLLDEPTNHLDLDSKDVLLEALEDFGGTLIFVSHDRYFVDKLATKVIEIGDGERAGLSGQLRGVAVEQEAAARPRRAGPTTEVRGRGRGPKPERRPAKPSPGHGRQARRPDAEHRPEPRRPRAAEGRASYDDKKKRRTPRPARVKKEADGPRSGGSRSSRRGSPSARRRSRRSRPRCRRPGSTRTTRPPSRSSTGTRR